jgi:hypothetical protein
MHIQISEMEAGIISSSWNFPLHRQIMYTSAPYVVSFYEVFHSNYSVRVISFPTVKYVLKSTKYTVW